MSDPLVTRKEHFDAIVAEYDEKALAKCADFTKHRYVSVERDKITSERYVKGHGSMRSACNYLAAATEEGEGFIPELVIDLDTGVKSELDLLAFVYPKTIDAVGVMLPRPVAEALQARLTIAKSDAGPELMKQLDAGLALLKQAIDRR